MQQAAEVVSIDGVRIDGDWVEMYRSTSWFEPGPVEWMRGEATYTNNVSGRTFFIENKSAHWRWCAKATKVDAAANPDADANFEIVDAAVAGELRGESLATVLGVRNPKNHAQWWILIRKEYYHREDDMYEASNRAEYEAAAMYHRLLEEKTIKLSMYDRAWQVLAVSIEPPHSQVPPRPEQVGGNPQLVPAHLHATFKVTPRKCPPKRS